MMIFEGVSDPRRTEDSLKLLLKDSDFNSALDEIENSVKLRMSKFDVLCPLRLYEPTDKALSTRTLRPYVNRLLETSMIGHLLICVVVEINIEIEIKIAL